MLQIAVIAGSAGLFVVGFVTWYTRWHRKVESCFERVPVRTGRAAYLVRRDAALDDVLRRRQGGD